MMTRAALALLLLSAATAAGVPPGNLLGITLGMDESEARRKLLRIGTPATSIESLKQSWALKDRRYGYLAVRYDREWHVTWVTLFARPKGPRVRYRDIGDVKRARHVGRHIYTWSVTPVGSRPGYTVTARGTHPDHLSSLSLSAFRPLPPAGPQVDLPDTMRLR